jgi:hypothetical protein
MSPSSSKVLRAAADKLRDGYGYSLNILNAEYVGRNRISLAGDFDEMSVSSICGFLDEMDSAASSTGQAVDDISISQDAVSISFRSALNVNNAASCNDALRPNTAELRVRGEVSPQMRVAALTFLSDLTKAYAEAIESAELSDDGKLVVKVIEAAPVAVLVRKTHERDATSRLKSLDGKLSISLRLDP